MNTMQELTNKLQEVSDTMRALDNLAPSEISHRDRVTLWNKLMFHRELVRAQLQAAIEAQNISDDDSLANC